MKRFFLPILVAAVTLRAADSSMTTATNAFTTDLYKQVARGDGNLILSPFNISAALSMLLAGARGRTAQEIETVLNLKGNAGHDTAVAALLAELNKNGNGNGNELLTANAVWLQKGFGLEPPYEKTLADDYGARPTPVDFMANADAARALINKWTEEHTKDRIKDLFPPGSLDARTQLVLTSAIYFYGAWQSPFSSLRTKPDTFTLANGKTKEASFMNQTGRFSYTSTPSAQILEMPYSGTGIVFDVLLPKNASGLAELEKSLTSESLSGWIGALSNREVVVSLPKFRAESQFSLGTTLAGMGMRSAFTGSADFSGISSKHKLLVSQVVHKAFVDVSERGTEAAAATGIAVRMAAIHSQEQPLVFRADHPFLFLIRDTRSGTILFIGRLMNP
jgi:serpin B